MSAVFDEHLSYFQLPHRLDLYKRAIEHSVKPGDVVADLGCGFGVLGLLCLHQGASKVYGIDSSAAIEIAREMADKAGLAEKYECIAASSFDTELPEKVDVIICDHVGWFGIDYGILAMMRDGVKRMLKPGGVVIPKSIELSLAGVSSPKAAKVMTDWLKPDVPSEFHWLREYSANVKHGFTFKSEDIISTEAALGALDLAEKGADHLRFKAELVIEREAVFHGLTGWFRAQLGGGISMTNSPLDAQNIERSQVFLPVEKPFDVKKGECLAVSMQVRPDDHIFSWTVKPPGDQPKQSMSNWNSAILSPADLAPKTGGPVKLNNHGGARRYVLGLVDGKRTGDEIEEMVLAERPDMRPTEKALRDYVRAVLARDCS